MDRKSLPLIHLTSKLNSNNYLIPINVLTIIKVVLHSTSIQ